jgi:hypothetical protein
MAPSIPVRHYFNYPSSMPVGLLQLKSQLQAQAQIRRQNYGKAKEIYSGRNKWSKIIAKPTTGMGATASFNPCSCYPAGSFYSSDFGGCYYLGAYGPLCF